MFSHGLKKLTFMIFRDTLGEKYPNKFHRPEIAIVATIIGSQLLELLMKLRKLSIFLPIHCKINFILLLKNALIAEKKCVIRFDPDLIKLLTMLNRIFFIELFYFAVY